MLRYIHSILFEILDSAQSLIRSIQFEIMMNLLSIVLFTWILILIIQSSDQGMPAACCLTLVKIANVILSHDDLVSACEDGDIRLSGGRHYREGRVEVCRNQQWGRVCDDAWDANDAVVVCRQLGLSEEGIIQL